MAIEKQTPDPARAWTYAEYYTCAISLLAHSLESARYVEFECPYDEPEETREQTRANDQTLETSMEMGEEILQIGEERYIYIIQVLEAASRVLLEKYLRYKWETNQRDIQELKQAVVQRAAANVGKTS